MAEMPGGVADFLKSKRFAVTGVSRQPNQAANAIYRKLRDAGLDVVPVNPNATEVEGAPCYASIAAIPGGIDSVVIATAPDMSLSVVRDCAAKGVKHVWFHRSFGQGSVAKDALEECKARGISAIEGGCPLMYVEPVDGGHKCIRWWLRLLGKAPR
jgi:uncharacterized protein